MNTRTYNLILNKIKKDLIKEFANGGKKVPINQSEPSKRTACQTGMGAIASKAFRECLSPYLKEFQQGYVHSNLDKIFQRMAKEQQLDRKHLDLDVRAQKEWLNGFQFHKPVDKKRRLEDFDWVCKVPINCPANQDRSRITCQVPSFVPLDYLQPPKAVSHFRLVLLTGILEPVTYFVAEGKLHAQSPENHYPAQVTYSDNIPLSGKSTFGFDIVQNRKEKLPEEAILAICIGVEFLEMKDGEVIYVDRSRSRMKVMAVR